MASMRQGVLPNKATRLTVLRAVGDRWSIRWTTERTEMEDVSRREVIETVALPGAAALTGLTPNAASADDIEALTADEKLDRDRVLACGFTEAEAN